MKLLDIIFEASVVLDVVEDSPSEQRDFKEFLRKHNIKRTKVSGNDPSSGHPEYKFLGNKADLAKMIDVHFGDPHLKSYINESFEDELLTEAAWSGKVETKEHPAEGLFAKGSAAKIASWALGAHKNKKGAMAAVNFYVNRAGKKLSAERRDVLDHAKKIINGKD